LENADIKLFESVLGGALRSIEFIYRSAGVNRPLRPKEEKPDNNISNTLYRDQINKVANSVKDIINGLLSESDQLVKGKVQAKELNGEIRRQGKRFICGNCQNWLTGNF